MRSISKIRILSGLAICFCINSCFYEYFKNEPPAQKLTDFPSRYAIYCWIEPNDINVFINNLDGSVTKNYVRENSGYSLGNFVRLWYLDDLDSYKRICGTEVDKIHGFERYTLPNKADFYLKTQVTVQRFSAIEIYLSLLTLTLIPVVGEFEITMDIAIYKRLDQKILWCKKDKRELLHYESLFPNPINYAIMLWYNVFDNQSSLSREEIIGRMYHDLLVDFTYYLKEHPLNSNEEKK